MADADRLIHALSGGIGGAAALTLTYPLVTVSCHQQTNSKNLEKDMTGNKDVSKKELPMTTMNAIKEILLKNGVKGFYAGLDSAVYGILLTNFIYYYFYETTGRSIIKNRKLKNILKLDLTNLKNIKLEGLTTLESIGTGLIAGCITAVLTNPIWVINTRSTIKVITDEKGKPKSKKGFLLMAKEIYSKEGISPFLNGIAPALILVVNPIIQYTIFEQVKNWIVIKNKKTFKPIYAFFIGAIAKLIATGSTYPYITLKSRMHLSNDKGKTSMTRMLFKIFKEEGIAGLYNGIFMKLSQSILTAAFLFYFKEKLVHLTTSILKLFKNLKAIKAA